MPKLWLHQKADNKQPMLSAPPHIAQFTVFLYRTMFSGIACVGCAWTTWLWNPIWLWRIEKKLFEWGKIVVTKQIAVTMSYVAFEYICSFKRYNLSVSETHAATRREVCQRLLQSLLIENTVSIAHETWYQNCIIMANIPLLRGLAPLI